jgi:hypothetical protein
MIPVRLRIRRNRIAAAAFMAACIMPAIATAQDPSPVAQPAVSEPAAGPSPGRRVSASSSPAAAPRAARTSAC